MWGDRGKGGETAGSAGGGGRGHPGRLRRGAYPHPPAPPFTPAPITRYSPHTPTPTHSHTRTHSLFPPGLTRAVSARLPSVAQRLAPGRRTEVFSPPSPATSQSPKGSGPAACGPRQPPGFGIFFFPFMTQLARLYSPITGDSA